MSLVLLSVVDRVATLTLNNSSERNLLSAQMVGDIVAAMDTIENDPNIGAIVVTGAGSAFCAGANLSDLESANEKTLGVIYEGFLRIARSELPTIAGSGWPSSRCTRNTISISITGCRSRISSTYQLR